jgi:hypothetical protein
MNDRSRWTWVVVLTVAVAVAGAWLYADPASGPSPVVTKPLG